MRLNTSGPGRAWRIDSLPIVNAEWTAAAGVVTGPSLTNTSLMLFRQGRTAMMSLWVYDIRSSVDTATFTWTLPAGIMPAAPGHWPITWIANGGTGGGAMRVYTAPAPNFNQLVFQRVGAGVFTANQQNDFVTVILFPLA